MARNLPVAGLLVLVAIFGLLGSTFVIPEWQQGIVIQLGKPVRTVTTAGLHFKIPFLQRIQTP